MKNLFYDLPKELQIEIYSYEPNNKKNIANEILFYTTIMDRKIEICRLVHKYIELIN